MSRDELLTRAVANVIPRDLAEEKLKSKKKLRVYLGIDPTGSKLHLGHTVPLRKLQAFADAGHHAILIIGSFTAMIGDPSGKDEMRTALTKEQVEENLKTYKTQASKVLDFSKVEDPEPCRRVELRFNHEWLSLLKPEELLKLASVFTKQQMEEREMFKRREAEGKPIHVHEFLYPLFVGYDSVVLDVDCELGATDQEFNMLAGRTLQKAFGKREKFILTVPIIEGTDGRKMSKTFNNCIYLEDSPREMYGKLMSIKDELITVYMECCTDIPIREIQEASKAMKKGSNPKEFKVRLAFEIVKIYHGISKANDAQEEFERVFKKGGLPDTVREVNVGKGSTVLEVMVRYSLAPSRSEARRLIEQGGVKLNDNVVKSVDARIAEGLTPEALPAGQAGLAKGVVLKVGKRKFLKIML